MYNKEVQLIKFLTSKRMKIELNGVQFSLKSYTKFEITRLISDQNCLHSVQLPLYYIKFEITKFSRRNTGFYGRSVREINTIN